MISNHFATSAQTITYEEIKGAAIVVQKWLSKLSTEPFSPFSFDFGLAATPPPCRSIEIAEVGNRLAGLISRVLQSLQNS
jgi:hypothetical protein